MKKALLIGLIIFAAQAMAETKTFYISGDDTADYNDMAGGSVLRYGYEYSGYADRRMPDAYGMVDGGRYYSIQDNPSIRVHTQLGVDFAWQDAFDSYGGFFLSFRLANFSAVNLPITAMRLYLPYQLITATKGDKVEINQSRFTRSSRPYSLYMPNIQWWHGYADPARYTWFFWGSVFDRAPLSAYTFANDMYSQLDARGSLRPDYDQLYVTLPPPADPTLWNEWVVDLMGKFPNMPKLTGQYDITFFIRPVATGTDITFSNKASTGTGSYNGARMRVVVEYGGNPLPSPTITNTPTTGSTPTFTKTPAPPTSTPSPSASFTATRTGTNTATRTATITNTPTATGTATWNPLVPTPTVTRTFTGIPPSPTRTNTAAPTRRNTSTVTNTYTPTVTQTFTATITNTVTATNTPTATITNTFTRRFSPTITNTPAPTNTNTALPTSTMTWTGVPSPTRTKTWTLTATYTRTPTEAVAPTVTATIANLLTSGANGYPAAGSAGYIPKLVVGDLQYDSLSQRNAPQQAAMVSSVYVPGGNSLTSQGLAVGGMSVIGADGNVAFGDSFTVDAASGKTDLSGDVTVRDSLAIASSGYNQAAPLNVIYSTPTLDIYSTGTPESKTAGLKWGGADMLTFHQSSPIAPEYKYMRADAPLVSSDGFYNAYAPPNYIGIRYDSGVPGWWFDIDGGYLGYAKSLLSPYCYLDLSTANSAGGLYTQTESSIRFANSDKLRYTSSTAIMDLYNGSDSVFSVDADQGNTTMANGSTLTTETIKPVDSTGVVVDLNATGQFRVNGNCTATSNPMAVRWSPNLTNSTNGSAYAFGLYPEGTLSTALYGTYFTDAGMTSVPYVRVMDVIASKGTTANYAYYGAANGTGSSINTAAYLYSVGKSSGAKKGVETLVQNSKGGIQYGGVFAATIGTGTPTTCYGVHATASGGSSNNYDFFAAGTKNIALGDGSQVLTGNTTDNTIQFGTSASVAAAGSVDTDNGNWTMVNGSVLTTETLSPVDTTGIVLNGATNKITIANDGNMTMAGTATYWDDVVVSGLSVQTAGSADPALTAFPTGSVTKLYAFSASADNEVFATIQVPHRVKQGTDAYLHIHWAPETTGAGNVVWGCDYSWANVDAVFPASSNATVTTAAGGTAFKHLISQWTAISGTGKTLSSCLALRIYRDADNGADTYADKAFLISVDAHFECDSLGSNTEYTK